MGTTIGLINWDTRNLDNGSFESPFSCLAEDGSWDGRGDFCVIFGVNVSPKPRTLKQGLELEGTP